MNEEQVRAQSERYRREYIRWLVLMTANLWRPSATTLRAVLGVVHAEFPNATELELRREIDYLESRELLKVFEDPLHQVRVDLTRHGIDIAEYTVDCEPGVMRPPKA